MERFKADNIDAYIAEYPDSVQKLLQKVRATVQKAAPDATEAISYAIPTFRWHGNLVHFAAFKSHIGLYPIPKGDDVFQQDILPYKAGKGTLQFALDKPLPLDLVTAVVKFRMLENELIASSKKKK